MAHEHSHDHLRDHGHSNNITITFWTNLIFTVIEVVGGILTNSVAILSDAAHDLGDSVSLLFSMIMEKVSRKKGNAVLTFGYKRFSILGAFFSALVLIIGSAFVIYNAVRRLFNPQEVHAGGMLLMAVLGVGFNGFMVLRLRKDKGLNSKVVFMHLLEDVLGWISVLIISVVMLFVNLPILDPILSLVIAAFVLSRIIPTFAKVGRIFLQYKPDDFEIVEIKKAVESSGNILEIHDIHLWSLDGTNHVFSCHVLFKQGLTVGQIMTEIAQIKSKLEDMGIGHSTLEAEISRENCKHCDAWIS